MLLSLFLGFGVTGCSDTSSGSDTAAGEESTTGTDDPVINSAVFKNELESSGLYVYSFSELYQFINLTRLYISSAALQTDTLPYTFNVDSNLLELQPVYSYTTERYYIINGQWTKVSESSYWHPEYSFDAEGALLTTNMDGAFRVTVQAEQPLDDTALSTVVVPEMQNIIPDTTLFSPGAYMLDIKVVNLTPTRIFLNTTDTYQADGYLSTFASMTELKDYYAYGGSNYIKNTISSLYDAQIDSSDVIHYFYSDGSEAPLRGSVSLQSVDGASFYELITPADYYLSTLGNTIFAVADGTLRYGNRDESYSVSWNERLYNQTAIDNIKDAVERGFQQ